MLALVATLTPACFYTEVINVAPSAHIERVDGLPAVLPNSTIRVSAGASSDPDGDSLTYSWTAVGCAGCPATPGNGMEFSYAIGGRHEAVSILLLVVDEHGAASETRLTVQVANSPPSATIIPQGESNDDGSFVLGRQLYFMAQGTDPDGDLALSYSFALHPPPAADPDRYSFEPGGGLNTYTLVPDVPGMWEVEVTVRDAFNGMTTVRQTVTVAQDRPPYIAATVPEWSPEAQIILLRSAGPRRFVVASVADDLDPFPGSPNLHFRWWVKLPGAALAEVPGHDLAELTIDPADLAPGDALEVRVEIADRLPRTLPCAPAQAACSLTSDDRYQRLTWSAEVR